MKIIKYILILALAVFSLSGCNKSRTPVDTYEVIVTPWKINTPNPLLQYVPADASFILATQRSEANNLNKIIDDLADASDDLSLKDNIFNWGNSHPDKMDFAIYAYDKYLVMHNTVEDEQAFINTLNSYLQDKLLEEQNAEKSNEDPSKNYVNEAEMTEWQGVRSWIVYHSFQKKMNNEAPDFNFDVKLAFHVENGVATTVLFDGNANPPEQILNMPKNGYSVTGIDKDTFAILHINYPKLGELLFSISAFADIINERYFEDYLSRDDRRKMNAICDKNPEICPDDNDELDLDDLFDDDDIMYDDDDEPLTYCVDGYDGPVEKDAPTPEADTKPRPTAKEWLKMLETTSISDDVCIEEFKSIFSDLPTSYIEFKKSKKGSYGFKLVQAIASNVLQNDLNAMVTDYAELRHDPEDMMYGSIGFRIYDFVKYVTTKKTDFINKRWKCAQIQGFSDYYRQEMDDWEDLLRPRMFLSYISDFQSLSFVLKNYNENHGEHALNFWASMRSSQSMNTILASAVADYPQMGVVSNITKKDLNFDLLLSGDDLIVATAPYRVTDIAKYKRNRDYVINLFVRWEFVGKWVSNPKYVSNYYFRTKLNPGNLEIAIGQEDY